jgi:cytochrome c
LPNIIYNPHAPERPGFAVEVAEAEGAGGEAPAEAAPAVSLGTLLASADAHQGPGGVQGLCCLP